jgi:predicted DNA repair protein MutK
VLTLVLHARDETQARHAQRALALSNEDVELVAFEKDKIKGAVRTDFILSVEIVVITLGSVATASFAQQMAVRVGISLAMTVGVFGLVGGMVKLDDAGLYLIHTSSPSAQVLGRGLLVFAPWFMKALSVLGTAALFLVGGGILLLSVPALGHAVAH